MGDLTDKELKNLKPRAKLYKVTDRDGMHAAVTPTGVISFRYQYRVNGRQEVLTIGRYSAEAARKLTREPDALEYGMEVSLAEARTLLARARRQVERGESPSKAKVERRTASAEAFTFGGWAEAYFKHKADPKSGAERLADSTLAMRRSVYDRAIAGELSKLKLGEVTPQRLKRLCDEVKEKRGPAVAVHVREVVLLVFRHAQGCGLDVSNPAESIRTSAIATFEPRERALSPSEVRAVLTALDHVAAAPTLRSAVKFVLLTGVRKSEFIDATWKEIDFAAARWTIPAERMKAGKAHVVPLSDQALDILTAFRTMFGVSRYLHPGRYDGDTPISNPFPNAPDYNINVSARYDLPLGGDGKLFVAGDFNMQGKTNFVLYRMVEYNADGNYELGGKVGYAFGKYEIAAFVRNLTNRKNLIGVIDTSNYRAGVYNDPRVFGEMLSGSFR